VRRARADLTPAARAYRRAAGVVAILGAAAVPSVSLGAQSPRPCTPVGADVATRQSAWPSPLDAVVTLRARGISLREALDRLGAGSRVPLAYSSDLLPLDRSVCVDAERQPLGLVLATLLAGTQIQAQVVARKVVLAPTPRARASSSESS